MLWELVEADKDATLVQLAERLAAWTGTQFGGSTISRALTKLNIKRKKSLKASEAYQSVKQEQCYDDWQNDDWQTVRGGTAYDLVFLDETGMNLAMVVSLYGRAQRGQWAYAQQPKGRGKNLSIIGAMSLKGRIPDGHQLHWGHYRRHLSVVYRNPFAPASVVRCGRGDGQLTRP